MYRNNFPRLTTSLKPSLAGVAGLAMLHALTASAWAGDEVKYPRIDGSLLFELQNDHTFWSDTPSNKINDLYPRLELATGLNFSGRFSIQSLLVLEPVLPTTPFQDRTFGDLGAYVQELYAQYDNGNFRIFGGKFGATFGTAWDVTPGVYGTTLAEDYELAERLGGGVAMMFASPLSGENTLTVNGFFVDNTALSQSFFTNRGRTTRAAGGAGNTSGPESFSITLDSTSFAATPGLTTHFGFAHQAAGLGDVGDENGFVAGLQKEFEIAPDRMFVTILEVAHFDQFGGGATDNTYVTAGGQYVFGPWNLVATGALRHIAQTGAATIEDYVVQFGGGYVIQDGFLAETAIDTAIAFTRDGGSRNTMVGFKITREFSFDHALR